jgi:hypothetical protein
VTVAQFFNQHSFVLVASVLLGGGLVVLIARRASRALWLAWIVATVIAFGVFFALRTAAPRSFETVADVQRAVSSGTPTLVEFYSDF